MKQFLMLFCVAVIAALPVPAKAQSADQFAAQIAQLNRTPASRNPSFQTSQRIFSLRVLDTNRQWVGDVADLKIDEAGLVAEVVGNIDRVGNGEQLIRRPRTQVSYLDPISSFIVPLNGTAVVTSPEALAAIAPAAGNGGKVYSFKAMKGAEVRATRGSWVGVVKDLLVNEDMESVQALVLEDVPGAGRYTEIAVPYDPRHVSINNDYGRIEFRLTPEAAKAVTDYARKNR